MDDYNQIVLDKALTLKYAKEVLSEKYDTNEVSTIIQLIDTAFDCGVRAAIGAARMFIEEEENIARLKVRQPLEDIDLSNTDIFKISQLLKP